MKKYIIIIACLVNLQTMAQDLMRISMNDGSFMDFSINNVKEMNFSTPKNMDVVGEWLWILDGIIERITFNTDGTFSFREYYTLITNDGIIHNKEEVGTYTLIDNLITINYPDGQTAKFQIVSNNEYQMISSANVVFYKVQEPFYMMTTDDAPISIGNEDDIIKYVDNYFVAIENNKIKALTGNGSGYALVEDGITKELKAYRIDVEYIPTPIIDWTKFFSKSVDDIISEFGAPDQSSTLNTRTYTYYDASIQFVKFTFSENTDKVKRIQVDFYDQEKRQPYYDYIEENYVLYSANGGVQMFCESLDSNNTVIIYVITTNRTYQIEYLNLLEE